MNFEHIKGLIFDLDGVIVSTEENHYEAWKNTAESLGIPFTHQDNERLKGVSRIDSLKLILTMGNKSIPSEEFERLLQVKNDNYLNSISALSQENLLPGVLNLLASAHSKGLKMAIGSSSKNAPYIITKLGLDRYFTAIIDGNGVKNPKPNPEVFLNAAKAMELNVSECLVFEDAESGIQAAKSGGFFAVAVGNPGIKNSGDLYLNSLNEMHL
jgi:beta-phosphoglucomutase